jgi:ABC-type transporter Mla subunit MlaD
MSSELKVGALFFIGMGLVTAGVFSFSHAFTRKGEYSVRFDRIVRLQSGDAVTYNGVKVGAVTAIVPKIEKDPQTGVEVPQVEVQFSIDGSLRSAVLVGPGSEFKIDQGLLGGSALAIISHGGLPMTGERKIVNRGTDPVAIDETMANINRLVEENRAEIKKTIESAHKTIEHVGDMSDQIRDLVKENRAQVQTTVANVGDMAAAIRDLVRKNNENLSAAIANIKDMSRQISDMVAENRDQVKLAIGRFAEAGQNVSDAAKSLHDTVEENRENLKKTMEGLGKVGPRLDAISENLQLITGQIASGHGTLGKLVFEDTLHDKAVATLDNVNQRAEELKPVTAPLATLKFWGGIEAGGDARTGATDTYAYLRIEPRPWKFYQGGVSYRTAPSDRVTAKDDPNKFNIDFNLLFGWRFFPTDRDQQYRLTLAGGLIDSEIGGYVETPLYKDWVRIRVLCRQKDNQREPNDRRYEAGHALLRAQAEFNLWNDRIWLIAGGNDLTEHPGFWGGIRGELLDNDLRNVTSVYNIAH